MRLRLIAVTISVLAVLPAQAAEPLTDVQEIVKRANVMAYYQGDDGKATVKMTITNKQGQQREREFNILRKDVTDGGDQNYYVYFNKPSDVRKMVYLVHKHVDRDDDRWLYLPAIDRVNRIAAGDKRTSFVGSDFLYEDVSGRGLDEDVHELIQTTDTQYIVKNTPKAPDTVEFSYYNVAIDRSNFVPMKMEFFDKTGTLYRTIESKAVEVIDGFPTVVLSVVKDLKTGGQTEMKFEKVKYNIKLKDVFQERYLRRAPSEARR
jgi:hypothetical protein